MTAVVDPTENVKALVIAEIKRQDDLRAMQFLHLTEVAGLRATYDDKLREAEAKRIDAIRTVDVAAVQRAAEVASDQAEALATQVSTSAAALRSQVESVAIATAAALAAALTPLQNSIDELRRAQYEAQGAKQHTTERREISGTVIALVGLGVTLVLAALAVAGFILARLA